MDKNRMKDNFWHSARVPQLVPGPPQRVFAPWPKVVWVEQGLLSTAHWYTEVLRTEADKKGIFHIDSKQAYPREESGMKDVKHSCAGAYIWGDFKGRVQFLTSRENTGVDHKTGFTIH